MKKTLRNGWPDLAWRRLLAEGQVIVRSGPDGKQTHSHWIVVSPEDKKG